MWYEVTGQVGTLEDLLILCLYKPLSPKLFFVLWFLLQSGGASWLLPLSSRGFGLAVWPKITYVFLCPFECLTAPLLCLDLRLCPFHKTRNVGKWENDPTKVSHSYPLFILASPSYASVSFLIQSGFSFQLLAFGAFSA